MLGVLSLPLFTFAVQNSFEIIPESEKDVSQDVDEVGKS